MINWTRDEGYSCEKTAHLGDFAAVIIEPGTAYNDADAWEIQVYDEADDEAMSYGEEYARVTGLPSEKAAKRVAETILEEIHAARRF